MSLSLNKNLGLVAAQMAGETEEMTVLAERVADRVREYAAPASNTGHFLESIHVVDDDYVDRGVSVRDRLIVSDDPGALSIEAGNKHQVGHFPFSRAARSF